MRNLDTTYIREVLQQAGAHLLKMATPEAHLTAREELVQRFDDANDSTESFIRTALTEKYPDIAWSESEFQLSKQASPEFTGAYWVCDPIDGAVHYLQGFSFWAISLCLLSDGEPVLAFVYDPVREEMFHAVTGEGAFMNGMPIRVSDKTDFASSVVATSHPNVPAADPATTQRMTDSLVRVLPRAFAVRMLGSVSLQLAYVACGRLDGYWEFGDGLYDWLAGALLIHEAGGQVTDVSGAPFGFGTSGVLAGNAAMRVQLLDALRE